MSLRYEESAPPPELRSLVHRIWWLQGDAAEGPAPFQRAMPDGRAELIFNLADAFESRSDEVARRQPLALLVGPTRRAMAIRPTGAVDLIGVRFRPEALSGWLRVGGGELLDRTYDLADVSAPLDRTLHEQLAGAADPARRVLILQRAPRFGRVPPAARPPARRRGGPGDGGWAGAPRCRGAGGRDEPPAAQPAPPASTWASAPSRWSGWDGSSVS